MYSSQSSDSIVRVDHPVVGVLVVDSLPLIVVEVMPVDVSVNNWLPHVHEEEDRNSWESKSNPVARKTEVEITIALV